MSNWFESSPARSVILHTLVVASAVWAAFAFIFDENKVSVFKAQVENEKATSNQYKAKTEVLEVEIARLRDENKKYQEWLTATPNTIPYIESKLKILTEENAKLSLELKNVQHSASAANSTSSEPPQKAYAYSKVINIGEAFVDPKTNATLGIGVISNDFTASAILTLPNSKSQKYPKLKSGENWIFTFGGKRYQLTLLKVDWFSNKAEVLLREI